LHPTCPTGCAPGAPASRRTISITLDRYGHRMPGSEDEAAGLLDAYLERADSTTRIAQLAR